MTALVLGMLLALAGFLLSGLTNVGLVVATGIFVFAIGEIICSPKFSEYVGMTAPPDRKAQYMGYSNIPFAIGWAAGNGLSGPLYDTFASRTALARQYLVEKLGMVPDAARAVADKDLLSTLAARLPSGATPRDAINTLWQAYHPWVIWLILGGVGLASVAGMIALHRKNPGGQ